MKLVKILSDKVQIRSNQAEFKNIKINDLLTVSDGNVKLVIMVNGITDTESDYNIGENDFIGDSTGFKNIECNIIGSVKNGLFVKSLDEYPTTNVTFQYIGKEEFAQMLGKYERSGFNIGKYAAYDCNAFVDGNKFFQRHACIFGNTGSGKSETVAKIMQETSKLPSTNIVTYDIHGEYGELSCVRNIKIGKDFAFPIWLFGFNDMVANILKIKEESATSVMTALRKCYYQICPDGSENKPIYFSYEELIESMEYLNNEEIDTGEYYKTGDKAGMSKTVKGDFNGKLTSTINILKDKLLDSRYSFLFVDKPQSYLFDVAEQIMNNDKPIKNIDLSGIPHDVALAIIGVITKLIYNIQLQQEQNNIIPITLICDEAHVYIPNNFNLTASEKRMTETFEDVAKEGRKFGITLFPATQRPSELNRTIVAQCANFIVGKLNNENDKTIIKGMLPDGDSAVIDAVTMFNPGEVLIIGDSVPIPLKIKVELAKERPLSRTIDFWDKWQEERQISVRKNVLNYLEG
ncbi:MAG: ATP-binding protein [Aminipila sp.]